MADNYLERRMEDYRSGKLSTVRMSFATVKRPSMALRAFVAGGETEAGQHCVRELRAHGWRVAFTDPDLKSGRIFAQSTGSQHHPIDPSDASMLQCSLVKVTECWGAVDILFDCTSNGVDRTSLPDIPVIRTIS